MIKFRKTVVTISIIFSFLSSYSQNKDIAYYNKRWRIMGKEDLILYYENSSFILLRNYYGILAGSTSDTLTYKNGKLISERLNIEFSDKSLIMTFNDGYKRIIKRNKLKEYPKCDPFINEILNINYTADCNYRIQKIAQKKGVTNNSEWINRPKHEAEVPYGSNYFKRLCKNEFKIIADSIFNNNLNLIDLILNKN